MTHPFFESAASLPTVPADAAAEYCERRPDLVTRVDRTMAERSDIRDMLGGNPLSLIYENHRNHADFLCCVLKGDRFRLLGRIAVWAYRAYHGRGVSFEYFRHVIPAWKAALDAVLSHESAAALHPVYDWLAEHHDDLVELSQSAVLPMPEPSDRWRETADRFLDALLAGDTETCVSMLAPHRGGETSVAIYEQVVQPALYRIGAMWEDGEITAAEEHRASALTGYVLSAMFARYDRVGSPRGRALVCAVENEQHALGAWMVADTLRADGWTVDYLGADAPTQDVVEFARRHVPDVVGASVTMSYNVQNAADLVAGFRDDDALSKTRIMVGGVAAGLIPELAEEIGADAAATSCTEATEIARRLLEANRS